MLVKGRSFFVYLEMWLFGLIQDSKLGLPRVYAYRDQAGDIDGGRGLSGNCVQQESAYPVYLGQPLPTGVQCPQSIARIIKADSSPHLKPTRTPGGHTILTPLFQMRKITPH